MQKDEQSGNTEIENLYKLGQVTCWTPLEHVDRATNWRKRAKIYLFTSIYSFILVWSWASLGHRWDMLTELPIGEKRSKAKCPCWTNSIYFPCSKNISGSYKYHAFDHGNQLCENCEISNSYVVFD